MKLDSNNHPFLNTLLLILNVGLEIILVMIALGFVIGIWEFISH